MPRLLEVMQYLKEELGFDALRTCTVIGSTI